MTLWWTILAALALGLASVAGVVLTLLTLPGVWLILLVAVAAQFLFPAPPFSWWTIGTCTALALGGEIYEMAASAIGAKKVGGGRSGAIGSVVGAVVGAVAGTVLIPIPLAGTLLGAVAGAGVGALIAERGVAGRTWSHSARIGGGAAMGRLMATIVKAFLAGAIGLILTVAALL